jgi:hypothetical protein
MRSIWSIYTYFCFEIKSTRIFQILVIITNYLSFDVSANLRDISIERYVNRDDDELLLVVVEKKVERCKIVELFKVRRELIGLKNLFSMRLLLSEAKL